MALNEKLEKLFEDQFGDDPAFEVDITASETGDVTGELTLQQFDGLIEYERQNIIWDLLDDELDEHERAAIVVIVANSPQESAAIRAQRRRDRGAT